MKDYKKLYDALGGRERLLFLTLEEHLAYDTVKSSFKRLKHHLCFPLKRDYRIFLIEAKRLMAWETTPSDTAEAFTRFLGAFEAERANITDGDGRETLLKRRMIEEAVAELISFVGKRKRSGLLIQKHFLSFLSLATSNKSVDASSQILPFLLPPEGKDDDGWHEAALALLWARDSLVREFTRGNLFLYLKAVRATRAFLPHEDSSKLHELEDELWLELHWQDATVAKAVNP